VDYFRTRVGQQANQYFFMDHGYNASPFWTLLNRPLVSRTRARDTTLLALAWIDIVPLTAIFALLWSTFGLETAALAAVLWGTGSIWIYGSMGNMGSFGRMYWLLAVVAAVCLLKRGWFLLGALRYRSRCSTGYFPPHSCSAPPCWLRAMRCNDGSNRACGACSSALRSAWSCFPRWR
jgi:hypothetical protein